MLISLKENHHATAGYVDELRAAAGAGVSRRDVRRFLPADIVTQVLNSSACRRRSICKSMGPNQAANDAYTEERC